MARDGGRPVGVLLLNEDREQDGWDVSYVGVVPEARRRGCGRAGVSVGARFAQVIPGRNVISKREEFMNAADIREQMQVFGSCGGLVGRVDRVEGRSIKLAKDAPEARGEHRWIPLDWVESLGESVRLSKPRLDVQKQWQAHPVREGEYLPEEK